MCYIAQRLPQSVKHLVNNTQFSHECVFLQQRDLQHLAHVPEPMQQQRGQQVASTTQVQAVAGCAQRKQRQEVVWAQVEGGKIECTEADAGWQRQHLGKGCQEETTPEDLHTSSSTCSKCSHTGWKPKQPANTVAQGC